MALRLRNETPPTAGSVVIHMGMNNSNPDPRVISAQVKRTIAQHDEYIGLISGAEPNTGAFTVSVYITRNRSEEHLVLHKMGQPRYGTATAHDVTALPEVLDLLPTSDSELEAEHDSIQHLHWDLVLNAPLALQALSRGTAPDDPGLHAEVHRCLVAVLALFEPRRSKAEAHPLDSPVPKSTEDDTVPAPGGTGR